jgi:hypothetical protein
MRLPLDLGGADLIKLLCKQNGWFLKLENIARG